MADSPCSVSRTFEKRFAERGIAARTVATSAPNRLCQARMAAPAAGSARAREGSLFRRATSRRNPSVPALISRRNSFVSSAAASSLLRQDLKRYFHEPASLRARSSALCNSPRRASAASARARSRSCSERQSRGASAGAASGDDQTGPSLSANRTPAPESSSRTAMRSAIAPGVPCFQTLLGIFPSPDGDADIAPITGWRNGCPERIVRPTA